LVIELSTEDLVALGALDHPVGVDREDPPLEEVK
jgi:hypothetical protein